MILNNPIWRILNTISPSRINSYIQCGVKFQFEYIHKMKAPGGLNMHRGSGLHKAIEEDNEYFRLYDTRLEYIDLELIAMNCFEEKLREGVFIPKKDLDNKSELISKARNEMLQAVQLYSEMEKQWIPISVEEYGSYDIGYPIPALVRCDMVDNNHCIYDWKTTAKNIKTVSRIQDWVYSKCYETFYGVKPRFKYVKFILAKKNPRVEIDELEPIQNYNRLEAYLEAYFNGIENNIYLPASDTDFLCSEACCPFYLNCEFKRS